MQDLQQRGTHVASTAFVRDRNELIDKEVSEFILRLKTDQTRGIPEILPVSGAGCAMCDSLEEILKALGR